MDKFIFIYPLQKYLKLVGAGANWNCFDLSMKPSPAQGFELFND
jgi:hypothetical protein